MATKYPIYFKNEVSVAADPADAAATRGDLAALSEKLDWQGQSSHQIKQALDRLASRTGWIWWFAPGALAASVLRH